MIAVSKPDKADFPKKRRAPHPNVSLDRMCVDPGVTAQLECFVNNLIVVIIGYRTSPVDFREKHFGIEWQLFWGLHNGLSRSIGADLIAIAGR